MRIFWGLLLALVVCVLLIANTGPGRVSPVTPTPPSETPGQTRIALSSMLDTTPTNSYASEATTDPISKTVFAQATIILATITAQAQSTLAHQTPLSTEQLQATQTAVQAFLPQLHLTQTAQHAAGKSCVPVPMPLHSVDIGTLKMSVPLLKKRIIYTDRGFHCNKFY